MSTGIYYSIYTLLSSYLYGSDAVLTGHMDLTLTFISTVLALCVLLAPFIVVFLIFRAVFGR